MATAIQRRRGTAAQHSSFTGLAGEITIDTTNNTVVVHDGSTSGGHRLAKYSEITALGEGDITAIVAGAGLTGDATSGDATLAVGAGYGITVNANDIELTNSSVRALFSAGGDLSYNASTGAFSFTNDAGDIESVTAGAGLTGGGTTGAVTVSVNEAYYDKTAGGTGWEGNLEPSANNTYSLGAATNMWKDIYVGPGSLYVNGQQVLSDSSGTIQVSATSGQNISILTTGGGAVELNSGTTSIEMKSNIVMSAGKRITTDGGGATGFGGNIDMNSNSINDLAAPAQDNDAARKAYVDGASYLTGGDGITNSSGTIAVDTTVVRTTGTQTIAGNKTFSNNVTVEGTLASAGGTLTVADNIIDLNSGTSGSPSENVGIKVDRGDSTDVQFRWNESDDNWEFTNNGSDYYGIIGLEQLSVTDSGGDGSLAYNNSTGVFTYTGPSASEVRAHISGGTGVTITDGAVAIGQAVGTTDAVTFGSAIISGNLTVNGTTTTVNSNTVNIGDNILVLNSDEAGTPSQDGGIEIERGTSSNKTFLWDETNDRWTIGSENFVAGTVLANLTGDVTGDVNGQVSSIGNFNTGDLSEGSSLYFTAARARGNISVTDNGGDGSLSYDSGTGVISYTGPSAAEVRAHISGGYGIDISSGEIATSNSDVRGLFSAGGDLSYNASTGVFSFTNDAGDIESVTAGNGLTGGGSSGGVTLNVVGGYGITANANDIEVANSEIRGLFSAGGDLSYDSGTGQFSFTNDAGDIESVSITAGTGLSGGGTGSSGAVSLSLAVDLSELTDMTAGVNSSEDELIILDNGADRRKLISEIPLSAFDNDSGFTTNVGDITGVTAGTGLSGGGSSGGVTLNVSGLTVSELAGGSLQTSGESFSDSDSVLMTAAAVNDRIESFGYTTNVGDITGVTAGSYLTGGGSSGGVTLNVDATTAATASKVVARDSAGNVAASYFVGTATQAQYADLAEKYESDAEYDAGTVIVFGGEKEITSSKDKGTSAVAGVISNEPAYMMNSEADGQYVALCGRVPCKVVGPVSKGDLLVASDLEGHAEADNDAKAGSIIGKAIGSHSEGEGVIEVLVNLM